LLQPLLPQALQFPLIIWLALGPACNLLLLQLLLLLVMFMPCMWLLLHWRSTVCYCVSGFRKTSCVCAHSSSSDAPACIYPVIQLQGMLDTCCLDLVLHVTPACTHQSTTCIYSLHD
jgi:hypothetical protein